MSRTSEALTAQYLNVSQRKLGTIIIQTVHILQHESVPIEAACTNRGGNVPIEAAMKKEGG